MLIKKELVTLPLLTPRINKGRILETEIFHLPQSGEILVADYYKDGQLTARFFSDGTGYHTVFEWPAQHWRQAKPYAWYWESCKCTERSNQMVGDFLHERYGEADNKIGYFIEEINRKKRWKQEERRYVRMEQHMAMFPNLPENFEQYCEDHLFEHTYLFFSRLGKSGRRQGRCGSCGQSFRVKRDIKHNDTGTCPRCGKPVTYKGAWYQADLEEKRKICIASKVDGQLLIRWVNAIRSFEYPACKRKYIFEASALNLHLNTKQGKRLYSYVYQRRPYGYDKEWIIRGKEPCIAESFVYTENLHDVFGPVYYNVDLKSGLEKLKHPISFHLLLNALRDSQVAEYLFKLGMVTLAVNHKSVCQELKDDERPTFSKCLGVNGQYRELYSCLDISPQEHRIIKACKQRVTAQDIADWRQLRDDGCGSGTVTEWLPQMSLRKFLNYFSKQKMLYHKESLTRLCGWYRDYLGMSHEMHVDLSHKLIRFPWDVKEAHDVILSRYNKDKNTIQDGFFAEAVAKIYPQLPFTEYEKDGLCIRLPQFRSDLITEGQSLNHCVGREHYYKNHVAGISLIFFIRKKDTPETPFYTMELDMSDLRILQLYGFNDRAATKEVRAFANGVVQAMKAKTRRKSA